MPGGMKIKIESKLEKNRKVFNQGKEIKETQRDDNEYEPGGRSSKIRWKIREIQKSLVFYMPTIGIRKLEKLRSVHEREEGFENQIETQRKLEKLRILHSGRSEVENKMENQRKIEKFRFIYGGCLNEEIRKGGL